ncbi:MAG: RNA-binding protein [Candidatus Aenigmatarchaeota archaeon]|nr:MAG: RNA-binding protein [Candidatus Aenigmarchaeota archaeon]
MRVQNEYVLKLIEKGERIDGRALDEYRLVQVEKGVIQNAEGSARVKIGNTEVLAGVKLAVEQPFPDKPEEGLLIVNAEFSPIASPLFETGPPSEEAIELARVVDRGIRESKAIQMEKLCIEPGEKAWAVFIDIHIINHAGNLLDASALAALAALLDARFPGWDGQKVDYTVRGDKLPIQHKPIAVSFTKVGNTFLLDPNLEEESVMEGKLIITSKEDGNICAIQKTGPLVLRLEEIDDLLGKAGKYAEKLRRMV